MEGKCVSKAVKVVNKSKACVSVIFDFSDRLPLNFAPLKVVPAEFLEIVRLETPKRKTPPR